MVIVIVILSTIIRGDAYLLSSEFDRRHRRVNCPAAIVLLLITLRKHLGAEQGSKIIGVRPLALTLPCMYTCIFNNDATDKTTPDCCPTKY